MAGSDVACIFTGLSTCIFPLYNCRAMGGGGGKKSLSSICMAAPENGAQHTYTLYEIWNVQDKMIEWQRTRVLAQRHGTMWRKTRHLIFYIYSIGIIVCAGICEGIIFSAAMHTLFRPGRTFRPPPSGLRWRTRVDKNSHGSNIYRCKWKHTHTHRTGTDSTPIRQCNSILERVFRGVS